MTNPPDHPVSDQQGQPPVSPWRPIVITLLSALILGAGSCFGFLNTISGGPAANDVFMVTFLLCLIIFIGSLVWAFVTWIHNAKRGG
jgi:hypothetical protein